MYFPAQDFYNKWRSECALCTASLADNWHNKKAYNDLIFSGRDSVIDAIAGQMGLAAYCEYYSLDVVLYSPRTWSPRHRVRSAKRGFGEFASLSSTSTTSAPAYSRKSPI